MRLVRAQVRHARRRCRWSGRDMAPNSLIAQELYRRAQRCRCLCPMGRAALSANTNAGQPRCPSGLPQAIPLYALCGERCKI
eukprot:4013140-Lingulodinium_polyedra.AAC.1